jgi:hypothetical protein
MRANRPVLRWGIVLAAAGCLSCGLFETRDPAEPEPPSSSCLPLQNSANVLFNVESSYGRTSLITCYSSLLGETFLFHPDPQDSLLTPLAFLNWDEEVEKVHSTNVGGLQDSIHVDFTGPYRDPIFSTDQSTETRFLEYVLHVTLKTDSTTTERYTGLADITIQRGTNGQWKIIDWADHRGTVSDSTWGLFRSNHR